MTVPTLVMHREGDRVNDVAHGRFLAERIPRARSIATEDTPTMPTLDRWGKIDVVVHDRWGRHFEDEVWGGPPSLRDPREEEWFNRYERASVPPGGLIAEGRRLIELDARPVLPSIHAPTLVLGFERGSGMCDPSISHLLADRIPGARLALVGDEGDPAEKGWWHWYGRGDVILREIGALLADVRQEAVVFDRILATVLFTDIVDATSKAVELGDSGWKELLARHHASLRGLLGKYRGTEVDTAGDGFFATFDGPARAVRCAQEAAEAIRSLGVEIRAGLHTGEVEPSKPKPEASPCISAPELARWPAHRRFSSPPQSRTSSPEADSRSRMPANTS